MDAPMHKAIGASDYSTQASSQAFDRTPGGEALAATNDLAAVTVGCATIIKPRLIIGASATPLSGAPVSCAARPWSVTP
jgi:hypothetical protein